MAGVLSSSDHEIELMGVGCLNWPITGVGVRSASSTVSTSFETMSASCTRGRMWMLIADPEPPENGSGPSAQRVSKCCRKFGTAPCTNGIEASSSTCRAGAGRVGRSTANAEARGTAKTPSMTEQVWPSFRTSAWTWRTLLPSRSRRTATSTLPEPIGAMKLVCRARRLTFTGHPAPTTSRMACTA